MTEQLVVLVTVPDGETGERLGQALVDEGLAACVNLLGEVRSIYRWQGAVETASERLCLIKTTAAGFPSLRARILALHPYELPEIIALPIAAAHQPYLDWIAAAIKRPGD